MLLQSIISFIRKSVYYSPQGLAERQNPRLIEVNRDLCGLRGMKDSSVFLVNALIMGRGNRRNFSSLKERIPARLDG